MTIKTNVVDPVLLESSLSMEQVDAIEIAFKELATKGRNPYAFTLNHNLNASNNYDHKRKNIVDIYINCLQVLSFIKLGMSNELELEDFTFEVKKMFAKERIPE